MLKPRRCVCSGAEAPEQPLSTGRRQLSPQGWVHGVLRSGLQRKEHELAPQKMKQANMSIRMLTPIGVGILAMTGSLEDSNSKTKILKTIL